MTILSTQAHYVAMTWTINVNVPSFSLIYLFIHCISLTPSAHLAHTCTCTRIYMCMYMYLCLAFCYCAHGQIWILELVEEEEWKEEEEK